MIKSVLLINYTRAQEITVLGYSSSCGEHSTFTNQALCFIKTLCMYCAHPLSVNGS